MKKFISAIAICIVSISAMAFDKADVRISYIHKYENHVGYALKKDFVLYANSLGSKFCDPIGEYIDSLCSTPKGAREYETILVKAIENGDSPMSASSTIWVFQSVAGGELNVFDTSGGESYTYSEPRDEMQWTIADSVKTVLGYECIMAKTDYHGREWTAWFAPEIPLSSGPWKFRGLPGLVLEAKDSGGNYTFEAVGMEKCDKEMSPLYSRDKYTRADRKDMLKEARYILENPYAYLSAMTGMSFDELDDGEQEENNRLDTWDYMETDYR